MGEEDFWTSEEGITLRLEDLAGDFTMKVYNGALRGSFKEAGFDLLEWVSVIDINTCSACLDLSGRVYRGSGFLPRQPRHPNCRCFMDVYMRMV